MEMLRHSPLKITEPMNNVSSLYQVVAVVKYL